MRRTKLGGTLGRRHRPMRDSHDVRPIAEGKRTLRQPFQRRKENTDAIRA